MRYDNPYPKRRLLRGVYTVGFALWAASITVRPWAAEIGVERHWILGVAPSLFAGVTLTIIVALALQLRPLFALAYGAALMLLAEVVQLWLSSYVFDPFDVLAGMCGAALATLLLSRCSLGAHATARTHEAA